MKIKRTFTLFFLFTVTMTSSNAQTPEINDYLKTVLDNLGKIESATYHIIRETWHPGDTCTAGIYTKFCKEYDNPSDSTIGASFVDFDIDDSTGLKFSYGYDGSIRAVPYYDENFIGIDDFSTKRFPFRLVGPPFFNYTKNIIDYTLHTKDSIHTQFNDLGDHYYFKLTIEEDTQVEFFGKAYYMPKSTYISDPTSIYEIWISKSDDLPYKYRREMAHNTTVTTRLDTEYNTLSLNDFDLYDYIPDGYEFREYGKKSDTSKEKVTKLSLLLNQPAPDWTLNDMNGETVALADIKSKVVLINFTGIGCGPCRASIPFLNDLKNKFSSDEVTVVAIESWGLKAHSLQNYAKMYNMNYSFLIGEDDVLDQYLDTRGVPVFLILDEERIIRKTMNGYSEKTTDKEITDTILQFL